MNVIVCQSTPISDSSLLYNGLSNVGSHGFRFYFQKHVTLLLEVIVAYAG